MANSTSSLISTSPFSYPSLPPTSPFHTQAVLIPAATEVIKTRKHRSDVVSPAPSQLLPPTPLIKGNTKEDMFSLSLRMIASPSLGISNSPHLTSPHLPPPTQLSSLPQKCLAPCPFLKFSSSRLLLPSRPFFKPSPHSSAFLRPVYHPLSFLKFSSPRLPPRSFFKLSPSRLPLRLVLQPLFVPSTAPYRSQSSLRPFYCPVGFSSVF